MELNPPNKLPVKYKRFTSKQQKLLQTVINCCLYLPALDCRILCLIHDHSLGANYLLEKQDLGHMKFTKHRIHIIQ